MLSCRDLTEIATDYLERRLSLWARLQIRLHILLCNSCRRYLRQIRSMIGLLRCLPSEEPAPDVNQRLLERFRAQKTGPASDHLPSSD